MAVAYENKVFGLEVADGHIEIQPFRDRKIELTIWGEGEAMAFYLTPGEARILITNIEDGLNEAAA
jgi:hypothetical protein